MKAIPILVGILATAAFTTAQAVEKRDNPLGINIIQPGGQRAGGANVKAARPARPLGLLPEDPKVVFEGPTDVVDGDTATYTLSVTNEGSADFPGPFTVELEFSEAFSAATIDAQGWTCTLSSATGTCTWPSTLTSGQTTDTATFAVDVLPPYGDLTGCYPERSPCTFFRGTIAGYHTDSAFSGVTVGGNTPPTAGDDVAYTGAVPAPSVVHVIGNDTDPDFHSLTVEVVEPPGQGTAVADPTTSTITYTPGPGYAGLDTFRYRVTDGYGGAATAEVVVRELTGGISFQLPLLDVGQVEIGRIAMLASRVENTTGVALEGTATMSAVAPAEAAAILAGTGYDPGLVAFDPLVFRPRSGDWVYFTGIPSDFYVPYVRPAAPLGTVWLARLTVNVHPSGSPGATRSASTVIVARSATAAEAPIHVRDDAATVPADSVTMLRPLANDDSAAGNILSVTAIYSADPWFLDPESAVGQFQFADGQGQNGGVPYLGILYTAPPGYTGTNAVYYAASEIVNDGWVRYDFAKISLSVGNIPPPTAVASGSATLCAGGSAPLTGSGGVSCSWSPATGLNDAASCTPTASPMATTTYTLTVRDQYNQPSTNNPTVTVTVNPLPIAVATGSASIPAGQSTPLAGSGGASCSWSPATGLSNASSCTPIASPAATTTYGLVVVSAAGCASTNQATATVTVVPAALADLQTFVIAPFLGRPGTSIPVLVATWNAGTAAATASTTRFFLSRDQILDASDGVLGEIAVPSLGAGAARVDSPTFTIPAGATGAYYVIASADHQRVVIETNEGNNLGISPWRIQMR